MKKNIIKLNHAIFKLKHLIIPILISVLILSCNKEKNQLSPSTDSIVEIKREFYAQNPLADNENFFNSSFTSYIKWDSVVTKDENNVYIKISSADPIYYGDSTYSINLADYFWLKAQKKDNKWGYSFISFLPNSEATREHFQGKIVTKFLSSNKVIIREYKGDINSNGLIAGFPPQREPCVYAYVAGILNAVYCSTGGDDDYEQWMSGGPKDYSNIPPSAGSPGGGSNQSPDEINDYLSPEQQQQLLINRICPQSFAFTSVVEAGSGLPGWKEASLKGVTVNTIADSYFENIWTVVTTGTPIVSSTFNLEIGVSGDRPSTQASIVAAEAANTAMNNILKKYSYKAVKRQMELGKFPVYFIAEMVLQIKKIYPEATVSSNLSGRTVAKTPMTGCQ
jgi:hypothetical protein